jgi:hypothetical protein
MLHQSASDYSSHIRWRAVGKILIGVAATAILVAFALPFATYGILGLRASFAEHQVWSTSGMVYWVLLFLAGVFVLLLGLTWFWLLRSPRLKAAHKRN